MISRTCAILASCCVITLTACSGGTGPSSGEAAISSMTTSSNEAAPDNSTYENEEWGYRFRLPSNALLDETSTKFPDSFGGTHLVQFTYAGNTYEVRGVRTDNHENIEQWLQDPNTQKAGKLSEYDKTIIDGNPAYQWKQGLITTFMFDDVVFEISGSEEGAMTVSSNRNDAIFQEFVSSFQMIKN